MQKVILVAAQDADLRNAIVSQLREEGFLVLPIAEGAAVLDAARENPVSLAILDRLSLLPDDLENPQLIQTVPGVGYRFKV